MTREEDIRDFVFEKVLGSDSQSKTISLLGSIHGKHAIMSLEKSAFSIDNEDFLKTLSTTGLPEIKNLDSNDIYSWNVGTLVQNLQQAPAVKVNLVYPATETHIRKYSTQRFHMINETPELYRKYVVPYINSQTGDRIKWVYNILDGLKEEEKIIYRNDDPQEGFVLVPDMKWDQKTMDSLYLCAIVHRKDISSIRDIKPIHKQWLLDVKKQILDVISQKYSMNKDQFRLFVHYQPSYYHFHIHAVNVHHNGLGSGISVGKAFLLDDIISQLDFLPENGFEAVTLSYVLGEQHGLWVDGFSKELEN